MCMRVLLCAIVGKRGHASLIPSLLVHLRACTTRVRELCEFHFFRVALQKGLAANLLRRLMSDSAHYKLVQIDGSVLDPAQRVADDVDSWCDTVSELFPQVVGEGHSFLILLAHSYYTHTHTCIYIHL